MANILEPTFIWNIACILIYLKPSSREKIVTVIDFVKSCIYHEFQFPCVIVVWLGKYNVELGF